MLKKIIGKAKSSALIKDNIILFSGVFFAGVGGFLYHFVMGRLLGPTEYGKLGVLLSMTYIFLIVLNAVQMGIAKETASLRVKKKEGMIDSLVKKSMKAQLMMALIVTGIFLLLSKIISNYVHVSQTEVVVLGLTLIFILLLPIPRGIMQGLERFNILSINNVIEASTKLITGVLFVYLGWSVSGAVGAIVMAYLMAFFVGLRGIRKYRVKSSEEVEERDIKKIYKSYAFLGAVLVSLTLFYTIDVILVKHFFEEVQAGYYAALAILGKVLFFGSSSIGQVMFPKVTTLHAEKKPHKHLFYKSAGLVLLFVFPVLFMYFTFPNLIINVLFGSKFIEIAPLLGLFGLYMGVFCFIYLFSYYFISLKNSWQFLGLLFFFNILEAYLIYSFHESLSQVITILIFLSLIFLTALYFIFTRIKDA